MNTYALRDSWQSIDIRGDEVGVLRKHTNMQEKEEGRSQVKHTTHTEENEGKRGGEGRSLCSMIYGSSSALSI